MSSVAEFNQQHPVLVIDLQDFWTECAICDERCPRRQGIPMYEDIVLPNDWTGEWYGRPACVRCYLVQLKLTKPMVAADFLFRVRELSG